MDPSPVLPAGRSDGAGPSQLAAEVVPPIGFREIVEASTDLLTVIDLNGRILYDNPAVEEVLGYAQGALAGRSAFEFIQRGDYPVAVSLLSELAAGRRRTGALTFRFRRADGEWCVLQARGRAARAGSGEAVIVVASRPGEEGLGGRTGEPAELEDARVEVVERLARAAEFRDDDTGQHLRRVGEMSGALAARLGLPPAEVELVRRAAPLHDVGKIGIPDAILLKPGPLLPHEEEVMRTHPLLGARILSGGVSPLIRTAEEIALSHHERWDGCGYPWRIAREEIPLSARIVALVDVYDALTHDRPYRRAWNRARVLALIDEEAGTRFDPEVAAAFLAAARWNRGEASV